MRQLYARGVAKTRVRVTPRVRVRVGVGVRIRVGVGVRVRVSLRSRVKAYGNITVPMTMQLSFTRYSYWFC